MLTYHDGEPFPGRVGTTLADSVPAWPVPPRARDGAPNVVLIVLDDVGFAQLGCFGSDIDTPHVDALAARGLRYRRFHTTAMCSPTRACLLTGRNAHTCGMGGITDLAMGFPGFHGRIPKACGFVSEVLRQAGWATYAVGKWHLTPSDELHAAAPRDRWPLGQGFERFYGFLGAETNHFAPDLTIDNRQVAFDPPAGYHLTEDLTDRAIEMLTDLRAVDVDKPFFLYFALGACHAPHHAPREWIDRYAGRFDDGWDAWRERTHRRQIEMGIVPDGTELAPRPPWVQEWATLPAEERRLYTRMMEVFAGFLSHTDHHIGRLLSFLDATGERDRTLVLLLSDNGASAEGGPHGTFNENFIFNALPHDLAKNLEMIDALGGPDTYGHYPWGWALAGNTPYQRWKRETHEGGIGDPLIIAGATVPTVDAGAIRRQYTHAVDIAATILDVCGVTMPAVLNGVAQEPLAGVSIAASIADGDAPEHRTTQYYEQFACRAIYHDGWKAVAFHPMFAYLPGESPFSPFDEDRWELYHVEVDPSECHDLAAEQPGRLAALQQLWWHEAGRYGALPLHSARAFAPGRPPSVRARDRYVYRPGAAPVSEEVAAPTKLREHRIVAAVAVPDDGAQGVVLAQGGRFGGVSLYLLGGRPHFTYNFAGLEETTIAAPDPLVPGHHRLEVALRPAGGLAMHASLAVDGEMVGEAAIPRTSPLRFSLAGEGLCCGYDDGTPVAAAYSSPFRFTGEIEEVVVELTGPDRSAEHFDPAAETRRAVLTE